MMRSPWRTWPLVVLAGVLLGFPSCEAGLEECRGDELVGARAEVTGVWTGILPIGTNRRAVTLQFHQRADHSLIGYVLGGTRQRVVVDGRVLGGAASFSVRMSDPVLTRHFLFTGEVIGERIEGYLMGEDGRFHPGTVFQKVEEPVIERRFILELDGAGPDQAELAVAVTESGRVLSGGYAGLVGCGVITCGGGVDVSAGRFVDNEVGDTSLTLALETGGGASGVGRITLEDFDPGTRFGRADWELYGTAGDGGGTLSVAELQGTRSEDMAAVLAALGTYADQYQEGVEFTAPHPVFSADFLHHGLSLESHFATLNEEITRSTTRRAHVGPVSWIRTSGEDRVPHALRRHAGADFLEQRQGEVDGEGVTFFQSSPEHAHGFLSPVEDGSWVISGNGSVEAW